LKKKKKLDSLIVYTFIYKMSSPNKTHKLRFILRM